MGSGGCGAIDEITGDFCSSPLIKAKVELAAKGGGGVTSEYRPLWPLYTQIITGFPLTEPIETGPDTQALKFYPIEGESRYEEERILPNLGP